MSNALPPVDRRTFLKAAGVPIGASALGFDPSKGESPAMQASPKSSVVVIGAGAFGAWTALHLREMGHTVTLVDAYGPGNSRATSGDETRQVRCGYGDRELYSDRKSTRLNSSHSQQSRMPSSA